MKKTFFGAQSKTHHKTSAVSFHNTKTSTANITNTQHSTGTLNDAADCVEHRKLRYVVDRLEYSSSAHTNITGII